MRRHLIQLAFNHNFDDFVSIVGHIPRHPQIVIEAGTPLIKHEGIGVVRRMKSWWPGAICADLKIVDGAEQEVVMAKAAGADYVTAVGTASKETLEIFVAACERVGIESVVDMINQENPMKRLWKTQVIPDVVLIHRGRDEENSFGKIIQYKTSFIKKTIIPWTRL